MESIKEFIDVLVTQDYFIIVLVVLIMILVVLIMALYKTQKRYKELVFDEESFNELKDEDLFVTPEIKEDDLFESLKDDKDEVVNKIENVDSNEFNKEEDILNNIASLPKPSLNLFDLSDEETAIISNEELDKMENKEAIVEQFEKYDEENAIISTDELEKRTQGRMEELGLNESQKTIKKYEDDQEKKAIISYEQLLRNASNITISYKEEKRVDGAPRINKIEVQEKDIKEITSYINEEDFLKDLKAFRASLET